jgi:hypothetical protein
MMKECNLNGLKRITVFAIILLLMMFPMISTVSSVNADFSSLTIVSNGQARAVVVVASDADERTRQAANTLVQYVQKSTGVTLPVVTGTPLSPPSGYNGCVRIYIGVVSPSSGYPSQVNDALRSLDVDSFAILGLVNSLIIAGPSSWGAEFGVDEFLERYVGVRWLMPGPDGEDVPQRTSLLVPRELVVQQPAFMSRVFSPLVVPSANIKYPVQTEWAERNRMHARISFHHNMAALFPPELYGTTHPEFYPMRGGVRYIPPAGSTTAWQPCFSEPGTVTAAINTIKQYFAEHPDETSYSLGVNDNGGFCEAEPDNPNHPTKTNSLGLVDMSDIYYGWVNQVAEGVLSAYPDKWFGLLAYQEVMDPPSFHLNSHVIPYITKDRMAWIDPDTKQAGHAQMDQWKQAADRIGWYDYVYGTPYVLPRVYMHTMAENYQYAKQIGVAAHYAELYPNWGEGPKPWVAAKLQWNPDQNADALLQEWYQRAVGPAAAADLKAFYDHWEQFWTDRIRQSVWFASAKDAKTYLSFDNASYLNLVSDEEIAESRRLLESVLAKAVTAQQKARATILLKEFGYYEASALSYPKDVAKPTDAASALAMLDRIGSTLETRLAMAQTRLALVDQFKQDPVLIHPLEPASQRLVWTGWNNHEFWGLADYLQQEPAGGPVHLKIADLTHSASSPYMREYAVLLQNVSSTLFPAGRNASFEEGITAAPPWGYWIQHYGTISRTQDGTAHSGVASLVMAGLDRGGPYQVINVNPGLFAARVFYYSPAGTTTPSTIQLRFNLMDANGKVLADINGPDRKLISDTAGTWASVDILENIPQTVGGVPVKKAQMVAIVDNFQQGSNLYVDDAYFYQAPDFSVPESFWTAFDQIAHAGPYAADIRQNVTDAAQSPTPSVQKNAANLLLDIVDRKHPANANPSFETGGTSGTGVSPWGLWVKTTGSLAKTTEAAHTGTVSIKLNDLARGGPYETVPLVPGLVAAQAYYYAPSGGTPQGYVQPSLALKDASGAVLATINANSKPISAGVNGWVSVGLLADVPAQIDGKTVVSGQFTVIVDGLGDGKSMYVDDAELYQLGR